MDLPIHTWFRMTHTFIQLRRTSLTNLGQTAGESTRPRLTMKNADEFNIVGEGENEIYKLAVPPPLPPLSSPSSFANINTELLMMALRKPTSKK